MPKFEGGARLAPLVGLVAAVGLAADAQASGFQLKEQSAEGLGNAFAGSTAKAQDLSTIFFNPAGMTSLSGHQAEGVISYIAPRAEFKGTGAENTTFGTPLSGNAHQDDAIDNAVVPAMYFMYDHSPGVKFGLAVNVPFGLVTDYDDDWTGRYHALKSELQTIAIQPSAAFRITDWLSVGGGPVLQYADAELTKAVDAQSAIFAGAYQQALEAGASPAQAQAAARQAAAGVGDAKSKVTGDDIKVGFTLGVMLEPLETTRIGLSYRSGISHELSGEVEFSALPDALSVDPRFRAGGGRAQLNLPDTASLGLYHELTPQWAIMGEAAWTQWSDFQELSVYRTGDPPGVPLSRTVENWDDTWFFSLGTTYKPTDRLKLQVGVAFDQSPVTDEYRTPRVPDADRTWLAVGAGYEITDTISANIAYTHIWVDEATIDLDNEGGGLPEHRVRGTYESSIDIISAQLRVKF